MGAGAWDGGMGPVVAAKEEVAAGSDSHTSSANHHLTLCEAVFGFAFSLVIY